MLKIQGLHKKYGNYHALDGLDMELKDGALFGFVGPNGAGKTTTIKIMTGRLKPDRGTVELDGKDMLADTIGLRMRIGYVPDHFGLYDNLKVSEYMEFFAACYHLEGFEARKRARSLLEQVGLGERMDAFVDGLSRGMQQRLCLARALIHDPELLIMDEPTAGLDPKGRDEILDEISALHRDRHMTIILVSHSMEDIARYADRIMVMNHGEKVFDAPPKEVFRHYKELEAIGLAAPQITYIVQGLKEHGVPIADDITTVAEAKDAILQLLGKDERP